MTNTETPTQRRNREYRQRRMEDLALFIALRGWVADSPREGIPTREFCDAFRAWCRDEDRAGWHLDDNQLVPMMRQIGYDTATMVGVGGRRSRFVDLILSTLANDQVGQPETGAGRSPVDRERPNVAPVAPDTHGHDPTPQRGTDGRWHDPDTGQEGTSTPLD